MRSLLSLILSTIAGAASAMGLGGTFPSIDGGTLSVETWRGQPVLVVNTASRCGFTDQYAGLQRLYDRYRAQGLVVLAIPSDDFNQELDSAQEVRDFCDMNYGLDLPMTDITHVRGDRAHPFYKAVRAETGFEPRWNFNKILLGPDGEVLATFGAATRPEAPALTRRIEEALGG